MIGLLVVIVLVWLYACSLIGVDEKVKAYYAQLKKELVQQNYNPSLFVISGRRWKLDNWILTQLGGAASKSQHKFGNAIDVIVLDVNDDGKADDKDVDIVFQILNKKVIKDKGGIGTYKNESGFFNRQMVHFDCRGRKARWHR